ncbi:hypothetical protein ZWY2020_016935 [Hordeum vulgare]|nr:hypothetical protein ZWY2020_016935 [Hordeum vulgare]
MAQETLRLVCLPVSARDGRLPRQYTLEGQGAKKDISPPLEWYGVPGSTRSLAQVVQDIDTDERVPWMHRVVANKSPEEKGLPEGFSGAGGNANTKRSGSVRGQRSKQPGRAPPRTPTATRSKHGFHAGRRAQPATRQVRRKIQMWWLLNFLFLL